MGSIQFGVVREDPEIEVAVVGRLPSASPRIGLIGSGGCTALTLAARFPEAVLTLLDANPFQIELVQRKVEILRDLSKPELLSAFGVGAERTDALTCAGTFEALFRGLKGFIYEFVAGREQWLRFFMEDQREDFLDEVFASKFWPVAFQLYFSDALLISIFGAKAVQNAASGSYPAYFQNVLERGLRKKSARDNYFLHHILLGHYVNRSGSLPYYLAHPPATPIKLSFRNTPAQDFTPYGDFHVLSFSNIFDWMDDTDVRKLATAVSTKATPGTYLIYRQLNNPKDYRPLFKGFAFDDELAKRLHEEDRSLFYSGLHVARKV